jgi:zinc transporter 1/2/3
MAKTIDIIKIVCIVVLFFIALGAGLVPIKVKACARNVEVLGIANAFAGGVFLSIALMHILPEAVETYEHYLNPDHDHYFKWKSGVPNHGDAAFPVPYFLVFCGYVLILLVDKVLFDTHSLVDHGHEDHVKKSFVNNARMSVRKSGAINKSLISHNSATTNNPSN